MVQQKTQIAEIIQFILNRRDVMCSLIDNELIAVIFPLMGTLFINYGKTKLLTGATNCQIIA